jgi:hypothetical protein
MKKFLLILLCCTAVNGFSQISHGGSPLSFSNSFIDSIPKYTTETINAQKYLNEDAVTDEHKDIPRRFGTEQKVSLDLNNSGIWETLANGDRVWRLEINSPNALSINLNFDSFKLPVGASFFVHNKNQTQGSFTSENNKSDGLFSTAPIKGDYVILEYYEPFNVIGQGDISVNGVVHGYRDFFKEIEAFGNSGACNVNAICDTNIWDNEIRSAVLLLTSGNTRFCSGALIANVPKDGTPFVLTANHCGPASNNIFMFNYQSPDCSNNIDGNTLETVSGCTLRASDGPSDFYLVELSSTPPAGYNVFYSGWSNLNVAPTKGTGIHFPSGDVKKISHDTDPLIEAGYYGAPGLDHWQVLDWNSGTTEGGSSGSPLYDQNHRLVGQLHGGDAACGNDDFDYYGKFSVSWDDNASAVNQLKFWLDPSNTGTTVLDGYDPNGAKLTTDAVLLDVSGLETFICGDSITPKITIRNHGSANLTSLVINYELDGGGVNQINWSGNLASFQIDSVFVPTTFISSGDHNFRAFCTNPNATTDQNLLNDSNYVSFKSNANPIFATLHLNTDDFGAETSWLIRDAGGGIYFESKGYQSVTGGEQITESLCLTDSCFTFVLKDSYGDGFCCSFGNGSFYLVNNLGDTIAQSTTFNSDSIAVPFCITTGIDELTQNNFNLYPNPNNGTFTIESGINEPFDVNVFDVLGKLIDSKTNLRNNVRFNLSNSPKGIYFVTINTDKNRIVKRVVVN